MLAWTVHPVRTRHGRTAVLAAVLAATLAAVWLGTRSAFWVVFSAVAIVAAVRQFLLPTTFVLDDRGAASRFLGLERRKAWSELRSFFRDANGVLVSPFPGRSRLESFRGIYLMFEGNKDEVTAFVKEKMAKGDGPER